MGHRYRHWRKGRRALSFLAATGVLLVLLQPPIPLQACALTPLHLSRHYGVALRVGKVVRMGSLTVCLVPDIISR